MKSHDRTKLRPPSTAAGCEEDFPGIVILDGGCGSRTDVKPPRVQAFVYGEEMPVIPTLPFGRWKVAS